jgi:uncharacterized DUF497 family protein
MGREPSFEWDDAKDRANRAKHGVSFRLAQTAFLDPRRVIAEDLEHSGAEGRYFCFGIGSRRRDDSALHLSRSAHPDFRRWLLAERQTHL